MPDRVEACREIIGAAVAAGVGGAIAAVLLAGVHDDKLRDAMILSSAMSLTVGLYCVYGAKKLQGAPSPAIVTRPEPPQQPEAGYKGEVWPPAGAAFANDLDASFMEIRMTGSLKSIRDQAEQGLFASDAEKARHLAAIWSMAACDLDDDPDQVAH
jgi:hypothetical protein